MNEPSRTACRNDGVSKPTFRRDRRLDTLRGFLLAVMTIDHFGGPVARYTSETFGYVSALEGFIFLSGFMFAAVYWPDSATPTRLFGRVGRRMLRIYGYQTALLISLVILSLVIGNHGALDPYVQPYFSAPGSYFLLTLVGLHQPVYFDILPIYLGLLAVSPLILIALRRGFTLPVLCASGVMWLLGQYFRPVPSMVAFLCSSCRPGPIHGLAWQVIWVAGLFTGFRYRTNRTMDGLRHPYLLGACLLTAVVLFLVRHGVVSTGFDITGAVDVGHLGWLRALNFAVLAVLAGALLRPLGTEQGIPWLVLLGRASLAVFAFHVVVMYAALPFLPEITAAGSVVYSLVTLAVVASLTLPAAASARYRLLLASRSRSLPEPVLSEA